MDINQMRKWAYICSYDEGPFLYYSPPEMLNQVNGAVGPFTDLWSLGILIYELVTSEIPFKGKDKSEILQKIINKNIENM